MSGINPTIDATENVKLGVRYLPTPVPMSLGAVGKTSFTRNDVADRLEGRKTASQNVLGADERFAFVLDQGPRQLKIISRS